jgi:hypothetical protein
MRQLLFALLAATLAFGAVGCGDSGVQEGPIEYKSGNVDGLGALRDRMAENIKQGTHKKKTVDSKTAESKPAEK